MSMLLLFKYLIKNKVVFSLLVALLRNLSYLLKPYTNIPLYPYRLIN